MAGQVRGGRGPEPDCWRPKITFWRNLELQVVVTDGLECRTLPAPGLVIDYSTTGDAVQDTLDIFILVGFRNCLHSILGLGLDLT